MQNLAALKEKLNLPKRIVITTHVKPDADALGSSLGLAGYLLKRGHQVCVITPTDYPEFLNWMDGNEDVMIFEGNEEKAQYLVENADLVFCLDFSSLSRIGALGELVRQSEAEKVLIDHHLNPETFAQYVLWSTEAAATAELVFDLIEMLDDVEKITKGMAEALYAGLMTDTGNFKLPATTPHVHNIVAALMELGADVSKVSHCVYDDNSLDRMKMLGFALSERLEVIEGSTVAFFYLTLEDKKRFNYQTGDSEGLVNYGLAVKGVNVSAIFIEEEKNVKISFRSFGDIPVNEISRKYFNGGGHKNAAGGASFDDLQTTINKFKDLVQNQIKELNYEA
ncbi:DHH family phosphoesterase [Reichenbachiella agariperforans]|uniref:Phosphoesterase RecJ domain-containing protein n=1 Tax=Reichenbachiella agariperforans TaxID=156994 RepID=A0A1M6VWM4_REIAG|nr:bifunctional oligoribonuclease/PAP phosphatase NrnA [Reichenbachiella agariperforans]MBU2915292.1 bifunctional oligoribonuclease/PAP phosphatase NrnA [Reichenbachiella agariperforans]SHK85834.1 phosphoesterase RecJ domain-containing protein [Reichenbachiella agariperforans]